MINKKAFSLVELSIVLIIIGILVISSIGGSRLIRGAKNRGLISNINEYKIAYRTFIMSYDYPPGDFAQASSYFGCSSCDGNNDKIILSGTDAGSFDFIEVRHAPQHLSLAKMIRGSFDGSSGGAVIGKNVATTKYGNGSTIFYTSSSYWTKWKGPDAHNFITVQGPTDTDPRILATDAHYIDRKFDDGKPFTGFITVFNSTATNNCTANILSTVAEANLPNEDYYLVGDTYCVLNSAIEGSFDR